MGIEQGFIQEAVKRFKVYKDLGDKTFAQLSVADFFYRPSPDSNNIAIIIQHLYGNMLSRWTNLLTEDGEKEWRSRDKEFVQADAGKEDLISFWNTGWNCLLSTLQSLQPEDLTKIIYIRTEPLTVYSAILRQLAHYPHHVGQIITIARLIKDKEWQSLSIEKGKSEQFNLQMKQSH